jgi:hypothetical protein
MQAELFAKPACLVQTTFLCGCAFATLLRNVALLWIRKKLNKQRSLARRSHVYGLRFLGTFLSTTEPFLAAGWQLCSRLVYARTTWCAS